jgi:hypothetical protein
MKDTPKHNFLTTQSDYGHLAADKPYHASTVSAGTLLLICMLAIGLVYHFHLFAGKNQR